MNKITRTPIRDVADSFTFWRAAVGEAAVSFESRWTQMALQRVDPELAENLHAQAGLFHEACFLGVMREIAVHGAALCRGYQAAVRACEAAGETDDAYQLGRCPRTGTVVAIGQQKAALERIRHLHGEDVVWLTPDEVASLFGSLDGLKEIAAIKRKYPGAEVIQRYPEEGALDG